MRRVMPPAWAHRAGRAASLPALALALALACLLALAGCRSSDALTEVVYDQAAEDVDYDNPTKVFELSESGIDDERVSEMEIKPAEMVRSRVREDATYGDSATTDEQTDDAAPDESLAADDETDDSQEGEEGTDEAEEGDAEDGELEKVAGTDGYGGQGQGGLGGDQLFYDTSLNPQDVPTGVETVAAAEQAAVLVQMLGGQGVLVASDPQVVSGGGFAEVFATTLTEGMATVFREDYSVDVEALLAMDEPPDALVVPSDQYTLSDEEAQALQDAGVAVVLLPAFTSDSNVCDAVEVVGRMIGRTDRADAYLAFHDEVLERAAGDHELASYDGTNFDTGLAAADYSCDTWTLVVSDWDRSARYSSDEVDSTSGVALVTSGTLGSPLNYYLQVGGALNTAALISSSRSVSSSRVLWQFSDTGLNHVVAKFTDGEKVARAENIASFDSWSAVLTRAKDGTALGSAGFTTVIAANQQVKAYLEEDRDKETNSLYRAYPVFYDGMTGFMSTNGPVQSSIAGDYEVVVNPCGLLAAWTEGSVESFLEAAWVAETFHGDYAGDLREDVASFYREFFGYEADVDQILAGRADDGLTGLLVETSYALAQPVADEEEAGEAEDAGDGSAEADDTRSRAAALLAKRAAAASASADEGR